jgi:hypothetical protein
VDVLARAHHFSALPRATISIADCPAFCGFRLPTAMIVPLLGLASLVAYWVYLQVDARRRARGHAFPPGPKPSALPFVGHGLQLLAGKIPFASLAMDLTDKFKEDILMLDSFGSKIVLLNSPKVCKDLFELRGSIYSSRAPAPLLRGVICRNSTISFEPHNDTYVTSHSTTSLICASSWRRERKAAHLELNINSAKQYSHIQLREAYNLTQGFLTYGSKEFIPLAEHFAAAIAFGSFCALRLS